MRLWPVLALLLALTLAACASPATGPTSPAATTPPPAADPRPTQPPPELAQRVTPDIPAVRERREAIAAALASTPPILPLAGLDTEAQQVQAQVLADQRVRGLVFTADGGGPLLVEVFGVVPAAEGDLTDATSACRSRRCYKTVLYSFAANSTTTVISDAESGAILDVATLPDVQPDVPPHLAALAVEIARAAPEVQQELQMVPPADMATMEATKTNVSGSRCERSRHLCVAPVFLWGERALWAVTDLTDLALVGVQWTDVGVSSRRRVTETSLQDAVVSGLCERAEPLAWGPWRLSYVLTSSDGLVINDVTYDGKAWLQQAKITDWHVRYPPGPNGQAAGFQDAVGCPTFSAAAVVPFNLPVIEPITEGGQQIGVALVQDFRSELWPVPCNYRYQNRYEFYADGRFRMLAVNIGRGCGLGGVYRPILRIVPAGEAHAVAAWDGADWANWGEEQWVAQGEAALAPDGAQLRIESTGGPNLLLVPGQEPWPDNAFVYVTKYRSEEGDADLPALGSCCREDFQQGPETFIGPDPLAGERITLWYVPQMPNAEREACWADSMLRDGIFVAEEWPCAAGPWLVPGP